MSGAEVEKAWWQVMNRMKSRWVKQWSLHNVRMYNRKTENKEREFSHCVLRNHKDMYVDSTMIQSNLFKTDTEGGIESVRVNGLPLLMRLNLEKM